MYNYNQLLYVIYSLIGGLAITLILAIVFIILNSQKKRYLFDIEEENENLKLKLEDYEKTENVVKETNSTVINDECSEQVANRLINDERALHTISKAVFKKLQEMSKR